MDSDPSWAVLSFICFERYAQMAKSLKIVPGPQVVFFGLIHWFLERNTRRAEDYGDPKEIRGALARNGWAQNIGVKVVVMSPEDQLKAVHDRKIKMEATEIAAQKDTAALRLLVAMKKAWLDERGEIIAPLFEGNEAFRRGSNYLTAMADRQLIPVEDRNQPDDYLWDIPVVVMEYKKDIDKLVDQLRENGSDKEGRQELGLLSWLSACKPLYEAGFYEAKLVSVIGVKRGTAQKVYGILNVNALCPDAHLFDRCFLKADDANYVPAASIPAQALRDLTKSENGTERRPSVEEVEAMITEVKSGQKNAPKITTRPTFEQVAKATPNNFTKDMVQSILDNRFEDFVKKTNDMSAHFDEVRKWVTVGKGAELLAYLKAFNGNSDVSVLTTEGKTETGSPVTTG